MTLVEENPPPAMGQSSVKTETPTSGKRQFNIDDFARKKPKTDSETSGSQETSPEIIEIEDKEVEPNVSTADIKQDPTPTPSTPMDVNESIDLTTPDGKTKDASPVTLERPTEPVILELPNVDHIKEPQDTRMSVEPIAPFATNEMPKVEALKIDEPKTLTQKQLERLEKQKIREQERLEREKKKEEERILKKLERERKDQERLIKKQKLEEEKERKREEERQRREEKKRKVDEERKRKEQERIKKDEEKKRKEEERKQQEEERKKQEEQKERSQMKISSFFTVKPAASKQKSTLPVSTSSKASTPGKEASLYEKQFLPFFVKKNTTMAASIAMSKEALNALISEFDKSLSQSKACSISQIFPQSTVTPQRSTFTNAEDLAEALNSTSVSESSVKSLLKNLPSIKYLQFYENAKPPYVGTWCSKFHSRTPFTALNPLDTSLTGYDYNYDSDLDWQDGDEGEGEDIDDLEDGDGDEDDINDDEEMDDFVENNNESKRRLNMGPMEAVTIVNDETNSALFESLQFRLFQPLLKFPINPNEDPKKGDEVAEKPSTQSDAPFSIGQLKATPLQGKSTASPNVLTPQKPTIQDKMVVQQLIAFIEKNSDFTIGTLSELAKKEFKNYTKSILKHTIQDVAIYNKKQSLWEIKEGVKEKV